MLGFIIATVLTAAGTTAYTTHEAKKAQKKAQKEADKIASEQQAKIDERNKKIQNMRNRLLETDQGIFGEDVNRENLMGN